MNANLADFDDLAGASQAGMSSAERDTLRKRWNDRLKATEDLCSEICALLFIYSEKENPGASKGPVEPIRASIAAFFRRASGGRSGAPELDILVNSIVWAMLIAAAWGYVSAVLGPSLGLPQSDRNPAEIAVTIALSALFLYGPALVAAIGLHAHDEDIRFTTRRALDLHGLRDRFVVLPRGAEHRGDSAQPRFHPRTVHERALLGVPPRGADGGARGSAGHLRVALSRSRQPAPRRCRPPQVDTACPQRRDTGAPRGRCHPAHRPDRRPPADGRRLRAAGADRRPDGADHRAGDDQHPGQDAA